MLLCQIIIVVVVVKLCVVVCQIENLPIYSLFFTLKHERLDDFAAYKITPCGKNFKTFYNKKFGQIKLTLSIFMQTY